MSSRCHDIVANSGVISEYEPVQSSTPLILHQLVDGIATGRDPSVVDLEGLAKRIWMEGGNKPFGILLGGFAPCEPR